MPLTVWLVSASYLPYPGGITEHVWHLSAALAQRGHRVTILTGTPLLGGTGRDADPPGVRVLRHGRTVRIPSHGSRACVTVGWPSRVDGRPRAGRPPRRPGAPPPDVVHLQSPLEPFLPLWALQHLPGAKVGTFHTGGSRPHWGYRWGARWLGHFANLLDRRLAVSREAARFVRAHLPGEYEIVPNGVDLHRFAAGPLPWRASREPLRALCVGRLDPRKGLFTLLEGLAYYQAHTRRQGLPPMTLTLVGDGPLRDRLARRARRLQVPVHFRGSVTRTQLPGCYRDSDICLALSAHGESFGINLLEAMASGRPIIAANIDGYRDTVAGSGAALLVEAGSATACGEALLRLAAAPDLRRHMGRQARRHAEHFAWPQIAARVEAIYRETAHRRGAAAGIPTDSGGRCAAARAR